MEKEGEGLAWNGSGYAQRAQVLVGEMGVVRELSLGGRGTLARTQGAGNRPIPTVHY